MLSDGKHRGDFTDSEWEWFKKYCWNDCNQCRHEFYQHDNCRQAVHQ